MLRSPPFILATLVSSFVSAADIPLSVRIIGPERIVIGEKAYLELELSKEVSQIKWQMIPPEREGLDYNDNQRTANFATRVEGPVVFMVAVATTNGEVAMDHWVVECYREEVAVQRTSTGQPRTAKPTTVAELIRQWTIQVNSRTKLADINKVAGALDKAIDLVNGDKILGPNFIAVEQLIEEDLDTASLAWRQWLNRCASLIADIKRRNKKNKPSKPDAVGMTKAEFVIVLGNIRDAVLSTASELQGTK